MKTHTPRRSHTQPANKGPQPQFQTNAPILITLTLIITILNFITTDTNVPPLSFFSFAFAQQTTTAQRELKARAPIQTCSTLSDLSEALNILDLTSSTYDHNNGATYGWSGNEKYFCGEDAPDHLYCECTTLESCDVAADPWGRDMGRCSCCALWFIVLMIGLGLIICIVIIVGIVSFCCHGSWIYNGFPKNRWEPLRPTRTRTMYAPAGLPLPQGLFHGYNSRNFDSGLGEGVDGLTEEERAAEISDGEAEIGLPTLREARVSNNQNNLNETRHQPQFDGNHSIGNRQSSTEATPTTHEQPRRPEPTHPIRHAVHLPSRTPPAEPFGNDDDYTYEYKFNCPVALNTNQQRSATTANATQPEDDNHNPPPSNSIMRPGGTQSRQYVVGASSPVVEPFHDPSGQHLPPTARRRNVYVIGRAEPSSTHDNRTPNDPYTQLH